MSGRRGAAAPIVLPGPAGAVTDRLAAPVVDVDEKLLGRLGSVCSSVTVDGPDRAEAGRDWWPIALRWATLGQVPQRPAAVARPTSPPEVAAVLAACNASRVPVTAMAGRSGVCGGSVPVFGGVSLDLCGLSGILAVDPESMLVSVAAGTFGPDLEPELGDAHGLTLGHFPQSMALSTVGGWVACRSAGQYSTRYGKIEDMVVGLEVALADGRLVRTGATAPRSATGPDLSQLFLGSEGTLGVVTEAVLRAHPSPPAELRRAYGFTGFAEGLDACRRILRRGATPAVLRLYDEVESKRNFETEGVAALIVLDEGDAAIVEAVIAVVDEECANSKASPLDQGLVGRWLEHRNDVSALGSLTKAGIVVDTIEVAGRWSVLPALYRSTVSALSVIEGSLAASAHQSHSYSDGACLYFTFAGRGPDDGDLEWAERYYTSAWDTVMDVVVRHGAAISHHHGIGLNRGRHLATALGPAFDVLVSLKSALDPQGILNPGKLGLPSPFGEVAWP